jgi:hypothetical protein
MEDGRFKRFLHHPHFRNKAVGNGNVLAQALNEAIATQSCELVVWAIDKLAAVVILVYEFFNFEAHSLFFRVVMA